MHSAQRHREILDLLAQSSVATVHDMAERLGVAESTVRHDLDALEARGFIKRTHGGAVLAPANRAPEPLDTDRQSHPDEKERIGRAAAALVCDNEAIFLDSGTTTEAMVPYLHGRRGLTIVTCGLNIAMQLTACPDIATIVVGGELHVPTMSFVGLLTLKAMELYTVNLTKAFIGVRGISARQGITNRAVERVPLKRLAIQRASEVIVVVDGSKVGVSELWQIAPVTAMNRLITDESAPLAEREAISALGITVTVV